MRKELQAINGQRLRFRAQVSRFSIKKVFVIPTMLLTDITFADTGIPASDHVWIDAGKTFEPSSLHPGDIIEFDARVSPYTKGLFNPRMGIDERRTDYKLTYPTRLAIISGTSTQESDFQELLLGKC